ncbi:ABC transporter permease [Thioclava sp. FR2]|uniref:ABC transporter permease n=1 Tax=Thioclava sp. FR2 TaxID=3445780 RepID=UPI003EB90BFB
MTGKKRTSDPIIATLSILGFVLFWSVLAELRSDPRILPGPFLVAKTIWAEAVTGALWMHVGATLVRVSIAFILAMTIGTALGVLLGRSRILDRWADPWVVIFLNIPALVVIVLCYLWIGLNETAAITAVTLNKAAMVLVNMREGARVMDPHLEEMSRIYRFSRLQWAQHLLLPQLAPYLAAAARNGLAVIWKIVLVVEFLGRSSGVGFQIHLKFQLFDIPGVMAYAFSFVAIMLVIDYFAIQPMERRSALWRLNEQ